MTSPQSSPQKAKGGKKELASQSKHRQLLTAFHHNVIFLQLFSSQELDYLQTKIHIFVFTRGQVLAKQKQLIDYIGVIAQGRAIAKSRSYQIGDIFGHAQLFGYEQYHQQSIIGESQGIIIAIRLFDIMTLERISLRNKIFSEAASIYFAQMSKRQDIKKQIFQFETADDKKIAKHFTPEWTSFFSNMDFKQKAKFITYFPFYSVKQKQMVANITSKTYLLYVVQGQAIAKLKQQQTIIQSRKIYNLENFIFDQPSHENIYCLSNEAVILLIDKQILLKNFKNQTFKGIMNIVLGKLTDRYKKQDKIPLEKDQANNTQWNIFKKYPNSQIVPLPKKGQHQKTLKTQPLAPKQANLAIHQTLFKQQGSVDPRLKTNASVAETGYQKLYSLKTEPQGKELQGVLEVEKLRKQVQVLTEKLKIREQTEKKIKFELIESKSRASMGQVFKQIRKLYQQNEVAHSNPQGVDLPGGESLLTFKQAFDKQTRQNKIQIMVAKCAFRWLYLTRKKKTMKKM